MPLGYRAFIHCLRLHSWLDGEYKGGVKTRSTHNTCMAGALCMTFPPFRLLPPRAHAVCCCHLCEDARPDFLKDVAVAGVHQCRDLCLEKGACRASCCERSPAAAVAPERNHGGASRPEAGTHHRLASAHVGCGASRHWHVSALAQCLRGVATRGLPSWQPCAACS